MTPCCTFAESSSAFEMASAPVTVADVIDVQTKWAAAIANISKIHKEGGDFIKAAAAAAGELYGPLRRDLVFASL